MQTWVMGSSEEGCWAGIQAQPHVHIRISANLSEHKWLEANVFDSLKKLNKNRQKGSKQAKGYRALRSYPLCS